MCYQAQKEKKEKKREIKSCIFIAIENLYPGTLLGTVVNEEAQTV